MTTVDRDQLIRDNMPLVGHITRETHSRLPAHVDRDDLTGAGYEALVRAAHSYDAGRGVPFARFAAIRLRGAMADYLRSIDWASRSVRLHARQVEETTVKLAAALRRMPRDEEIAEVLDVSVSAVASYRADADRAHQISLDGTGPVADTDWREILAGDLPTPGDLLLAAEDLADVRAAIDRLPERMRDVLVFHTSGVPMLEIAESLGVTESRVSQLRKEAVGLVRVDLGLAQPKTRAEHEHLVTRGWAA